MAPSISNGQWPLRPINPADRARLAAARPILANAPRERDGLRLSRREDLDHFEIERHSPQDVVALSGVGVADRHPIIIEKLRHLIATIGNRLDNQRPWKRLRPIAEQLVSELDVPLEQIPQRIARLHEYYASLAKLVEQDDRLRRNASEADDPLGAVDRSALTDCVDSLAPWLRSFPSVRESENERQASLARPELYESVRAQLPDARAVIEMAGKGGVLSPEDTALALMPIETAEAGPPGSAQAERAGYRGLANARNLIVTATGFVADASSTLNNQAASLLQKLRSFLVRAAAPIKRIASTMAQAVSEAITSVMRVSSDADARSGSVPISAEPSIVREDIPSNPPPDFDIEEVKRLILAGKAPPAAWVPFIGDLDFRGTNLVDLEPLSGLTSLRMLYLNDTRITRLEPLGGLIDLGWLELSGTQVADITPVSGLTNLQHLDVSGTPVAKLPHLSRLKSLYALDLSGTQITDLDLKRLCELTNLQTLLLRDTQITDLAPLSACTSLWYLALDRTPVTNLEPLRTLKGLAWLDLRDTEVTDLSPLRDLPSLQELRLE
jgi:hypothetical protein